MLMYFFADFFFLNLTLFMIKLRGTGSYLFLTLRITLMRKLNVHSGLQKLKFSYLYQKEKISFFFNRFQKRSTFWGWLWYLLQKPPTRQFFYVI
jgi:hypothetical protein